MIVANLVHIKAANGMFYYGLDYIAGMADEVRCILVRPALYGLARQRFPGITVKSCSVTSWLAEIARARVRDDLIYTPTSHPIAGYRRQIIVVHDRYPFDVRSRSGRIKRSLLKTAIRLSGCDVGYVNRSDAQQFLCDLGVPQERTFFAPNRPLLDSIVPIRTPASRRTVGLFGSDSPKKNYGALFEVVACSDQNMEFLVYGHDTPYLRAVMAAFPRISITLVKSDEAGLSQFLAMVDVVGSVAIGEGFGRPIASALYAGIPCVLLDAPVFREFFDGAATFSPTIADFVAQLSQITRDDARRDRFRSVIDGIVASWRDAVLAIIRRENQTGAVNC
jgi:glycosyltransferase involved in cell wall biosynthesis